MVQKPSVKLQNGARRKLRGLLGNFPPQHFKPLQRRVLHGLPEIRVQQIMLQSPRGELIRAILTGPEGEWHNLPAVLYCHAHGNNYQMGANELIEGRPSLFPQPYGQALALQGIVALCIDMPCFGPRFYQVEIETSKRLLFQGQTLLGQMLSELGGALAFLSSLDGVDPRRVGVFGFSMGATHAFWLAALEPKIKALAHACAFADLGSLLSSGAHDLHGLYMTVPGLVRQFSTGNIATIVAPRPQLACVGLLDPLTPPDAVERAISDVRSGYSAMDAESYFKSYVSSDTGHVETAEMRREIIAFFKAWL